MGSSKTSDICVFFLVLNAISFELTEVAAKMDYCKRGLCPAGRKHLACDNDGDWWPNCPRSAEMISLRRYRKFIVKEHNKLRNRVAGGKYASEGLESAARMASMVWDKDLAEMAALNVRKCKAEVDYCKPTEKYELPGQNIGVYYSETREVQIKTLLKDRIKNWWNTRKYVKPKYIKSYPEKHDMESFGLFTEMVRDPNNAIGCALSSYRQNGKQVFLLCCIYAVTNYFGYPVYEFGDPGSECRTGTHRKYKNLCSEQERYF